MADDLTAYLEESRYSQQSLAKLLDDLFGEDAGMYDAQVPESIDMTPVPLPGPDELVGQQQSASLPPMQVEGSSSKRPQAAPAPAASRRRTQVVVGGAALSVAGALLALVFTKRADGPTSPVSAQAAPVEAAPAMAPPPPPLPATVLVRVLSEPTGAEVVDVAGEALGVTPTEIILPRGTTGVSLILRKAGFEELRQVVVPDRDTTATVTLKKIEPTAVPVRPAPKPMRPPVKAKAKSGAQGAAPAGDGKVKEAITIDPFEDGK